ncbi:MAG TPA: DUF3303 domain-containing protein [Candidatus Syntrophoarchaeum butanivorans]|uniref:DUF3303 domain-containing protein n=1 Tax=Candidatus Syntropharchaeum butanivorans TaxID=1839936 RepID=A0A7J2S1E5_9EURY|nr:DUF3303 domain-containing protein [Candidatus Syntrophoarchaeum butanivorans]
MRRSETLINYINGGAVKYISRRDEMLFVIEISVAPERRDEIFERVKRWEFPEEVRTLAKVVKIGENAMILIVDVPDVSTLTKLTAPFSDIATFRISPALRWEDIKALMSGYNNPKTS